MSPTSCLVFPYVDKYKVFLGIDKNKEGGETQDKERIEKDSTAFLERQDLERVPRSFFSKKQDPP